MNKNPFSLEGKRILITGASSGIGQAIAIQCSRLGATMILVARNEERLQKTMSLLDGCGHEYLTCDLGRRDEVEALVSNVENLDGLVNNAGFIITRPLQYIDYGHLDSILEVNTLAPIILTSRLVKQRRLNKGASIVFTASLAGTKGGTFGNSLYSASKAAIDGFVKNAALELASKKIRVNAVCPGMVETSIFSAGLISEEQLELDAKKYPLGRYGKPDEIAYAVVYFLSDASSWTTGASLVIDGGRSINLG